MIGRTLALTLAALAVAAPTAASAKQPKPIELPNGPIAGVDGTRWVIESRRGHAVRVRDSVTGIARTIDPISACSVDPELYVAARGKSVWRCNDDGYHVVDLATGEASPVLREAGPELGGETLTPNDVGSRWVIGRYSGLHYSYTGALRWPAGEARSLRRQAVNTYLDPNSEQLERPMCSPLRSPPGPPDDAYAQADDITRLQYERPYAVAPALDGTEPVRLLRCGTKRAKTLCNGGCSSVQLAGGVVTFVKGRKVYAHVAKSGRTYIWSFPPDYSGPGFIARHVKNEIYVSVEDPYRPVGNRGWVIRGRLR